jgi:hypothetical protein
MDRNGEVNSAKFRAHLERLRQGMFGLAKKSRFGPSTLEQLPETIDSGVKGAVINMRSFLVKVIQSEIKLDRGIKRKVHGLAGLIKSEVKKPFVRAQRNRGFGPGPRLEFR